MKFPYNNESADTTELYYITGGPARDQKVSPKTSELNLFTKDLLFIKDMEFNAKNMADLTPFP
jgi:hypothetical protein